ncbi:MAG: uracil phosphoribosyltransferase [Flavobacteriaceae bacterium]|nr:uracil phosphoribosyltransferase [Flavobacteriaceae bacterium]
MISNNIFRAIAEFFTNVLFVPYDAFRSIDSWWTTNIVNTILITITFGLFIFWLGQLQKFKKTGNE